MNSQSQNYPTACAHIHVERFQIEKDGKVFEEQWRCRDCGTKFVTLDNLFAGPQNIEVMPEQATLRDQFAMAAMIADALSSAVIAVSYLAQGNTFTGDYPKPEEGVEEYFKTADALMEARK